MGRICLSSEVHRCRINLQCLESRLDLDMKLQKEAQYNQPAAPTKSA